MTAPIRVVVVDDSALMRSLISNMLESDDRLRVVGTAKDGMEAVHKVREFRPDVVTLDIEMPKLDGLGALKRIMNECPARVIMLSGLQEPRFTFEALGAGAVDFVVKPSGTFSVDIDHLAADLVLKVKIAAGVKLSTVAPKPKGDMPATEARPLRRVVGIGSSTGGPRALEKVLASLPGDIEAAVLIVQHLPTGFSKALAEWLDRVGPLAVKEAEDGDRVEPGMCLIAPADHHMVASKNGHRPVVRLEDGPKVCGVRPSADKMLKSMANIFGSRSVGVLLTGMGADGATGLAKIKQKNGTTIGQDEKTSVVFGMSKAAKERGCLDRLVPLDRVAREIVKAVKETG